MKQLIIVFALALCLIMISQTAQAIGLDYYRMELEINEDMSVENIIAIKFDKPIAHLDYQFDFRIHDLNSSSNFDGVMCETFDRDRGSLVSCNFFGMTTEKNLFIMNFKTNHGVQRVDNKYQFNMNYPVSLPIDKAFVIIKLPENGVLAGENVNESYSPQGGTLLSDGKRILVYWEMDNLTAGNTMQFSVLYDMPLTEGSLFNVIIVSLTMIIILVMIGVTFYLKKSVSKTSKETSEIVSNVLNEDEKKVVDIVKRNEGEVIQRVIVRETDFSKAKVSRIVSNLKHRNVLEVIPIGRKNKIKLKIDMGSEEDKSKED